MLLLELVLFQVQLHFWREDGVWFRWRFRGGWRWWCNLWNASTQEGGEVRPVSIPRVLEFALGTEEITCDFNVGKLLCNTFYFRKKYASRRFLSQESSP